MGLTKEVAIEQAKKVFNHIGLVGDTEIARCIGFLDSGEDYYWVVQKPGGGIINSSMVGTFTSLKDCNYPRYDYLEKMMTEVWDCPKHPYFSIEIREFQSYEDMSRFYFKGN